MTTNKHNWQEIFNDTRNYDWYCNHGNTHALDILGYRVKSYLVESDAYIHTRYLVNVYIGKTDIMQEILYKSSRKDDDFAPFPPNVFHNLFPDINFAFLGDNEYWKLGTDWTKFVEFVEMDDRFLFKFSLQDWRRFIWGVNLNNISYSFVGLLLRRFGGALTFACRYPNTIKELDDVAAVWLAVKDLARLEYKRNGYFEDAIERYRLLMADKMLAIEEYQSNLDAICDGAANAMNTLESQYGLKIMV